MLEAASWVAGIVSALIALAMYIRERHRSHLGESSSEPAPFNPPTASEVRVTDSAASVYAVAIGNRLRVIRESTLQISLREMAEFLGLEAVSDLEYYESGRIEFPLHLVKKIEAFFRLNPMHAEQGKGPTFEPFTLSQAATSAFLKDGYTPILVCSPANRKELYCYQLFVRRVAGMCQIAFAERPGSFASEGGGKINIGYLINSLLDLQKSPADVRIVKATPNEWVAIENCEYYSRDPFFRIGSADWHCARIFEAWFEEYSQSRARWEGRPSLAHD